LSLLSRHYNFTSLVHILTISRKHKTLYRLTSCLNCCCDMYHCCNKGWCCCYCCCCNLLPPTWNFIWCKDINVQCTRLQFYWNEWAVEKNINFKKWTFLYSYCHIWQFLLLFAVNINVILNGILLVFRHSAIDGKIKLVRPKIDKKTILVGSDRFRTPLQYFRWVWLSRGMIHRDSSFLLN